MNQRRGLRGREQIFGNSADVIVVFYVFLGSTWIEEHFDITNYLHTSLHVLTERAAVTTHHNTPHGNSVDLRKRWR